LVARECGIPLRAKIVRRFLDGDGARWQDFTSSSTEQFPLLVVHDENDGEVNVRQAHLIAAAHLGPTYTLLTSGFGHNRILADDKVVRRLREHAADAVGTVHSTSGETLS
jgi:hypothetical protein